MNQYSVETARRDEVRKKRKRRHHETIGSPKKIGGWAQEQTDFLYSVDMTSERPLSCGSDRIVKIRHSIKVVDAGTL